MRRSMRLGLLGVSVAAMSGAVACGDFGDGSLESDDGGGGYHAGTSAGTGTGTGNGTPTGGGAGLPGNNVLPPQEEEPEVPTCAELDDDEPLVLYLSADDSNSMGSPALARELLSKGVAPSNLIRTYEFLNYYNVDYPAPDFGELAIYPQMEAAATEGHYDLQIGLRSYDAALPRRPMTITFVLDTSGSMGGEAILREQAVVKAIAASLTDGDIVNMVTWSTNQQALMAGYEVSGPNDPTLLAQANSLTASGGTDLEAGLAAGYALATEHYGEMRLNRVVLVSDGGANVGVTVPELIATHSNDADSEGIYLVGVGTGPYTQYGDGLMDVVTDAGRGAYVYLDSIAEAEAMFTERFDEVMEVAARGVNLELTLPWYFQMHEFYGEEYSEDPKEVEAQHLSPSDVMVFNQVLKACDASVVNEADAIAIKATWETPITREPMVLDHVATVGELLGGETAQLRMGKAIVAYAEALKTGATEDIASAQAALSAVDPALGGDAIEEIAGLLAKHPKAP